MAKPVRKILMVDDSPEDKAVFRRYLNKDKNYKYVVTETDKTDEVIELCHKEKPDCILLDYNLPTKNGVQIIRDLVDEFGENNIPVVMLSGSSVVETAVEALRVGAHDFLVKGSITSVELRLKVDNAIEKVDLWRQKNRTEEELRESEERMSLAFEAAELGLWDWNIIKDSAVWKGNQVSIFGHNSDETTHSFDQFLEFIHLNDREEFKEYIQGILKNEKEYYKEFRVIYPNDDVRWIVAKGKVFRNKNSEPVRLMGINYDITRRKNLEFEREEILLREKVLRLEAEAANKAKDEFLAVLSHELRSPLNSMLGWARMLRSGKLDENKSKHAVAVIEDNIRLQNSLIEDILDVSRIIGGKMNLEFYDIDFALIVNSAIETVRPSAESKNIKIQSSIEDFESKMKADSARLQQVIGNLLTNAVKFTDEGGEIDVRLKKVGNVAKLDITDTGIGIGKENITTIFDRFRQVDSSTKRDYSGLGLGLAIVKSLVEMHNGKVSVTSDGIGKGATFTVELPLLTLDENAKAKSAKVKKDKNPHETEDDKTLLEGLEIFIVDDDVYSLELIEYVLESQGAEVYGFQNAKETLAKLEEKIPDLLVSDIGMSKMDGLEFIREVRKRFDEKILPAIALTAFAGLDDREKSIAAGFQLHMPKPIDIEGLPAAIKELIENNG